MSKNLNNIVFFACNEGGHFSQMMVLGNLFGKYKSVLVTDNRRANKEVSQLQSIDHIELVDAMSKKRESDSRNHVSHSSRWAYGFVHLKMMLQCRNVWKRYRPKVIISTGSNIAVHMFIYGKLRGSKLIFIETRAHVYSKSFTGKIAGRIADVVFVQWPEMKELYSKAEYCGTLV